MKKNPNLKDYNLNTEFDLNEYIVVTSKIYIGLREIKDFEFETLLYLPTKVTSQPHLYLLIDNYKSWDSLNKLQKYKLNIESVISNKQKVKIKNLQIGEGDFDITDTQRGYLLLYLPKFVFKYNINYSTKCNQITFRISNSELLRTRRPEHNLKIFNLEHLGIKSIKTDKLIQNNLLYIEFIENINSYFSFTKNVKPIIELITYLTSFAERRRLTWSSFICNDNVEHYNCRRVFYQDQKEYRLVSTRVFDEFLSKALMKIQFEDIRYYLAILNLVVTAVKYPTHVKIILLNTALETILKKKFGKKGDKFKAELIKELNTVVFDIENIKDMIDIRNDLTHGDYVSSRKQFKFSNSWQTLLERIVLNELGWNDLTDTDVDFRIGYFVPGLV